MRKFKVRYYELTINENGNEYNEVKESEVKAANFRIQSDMAVFELDSFKNKALYRDVVSVEEIEGE